MQRSPYKFFFNLLHVLWLGGTALAKDDFLPSSPLSLKVIGHRGYAGLYPENTLLAFSKAIDLGVHGIEFDVHCTQDGEVVVYHDAWLNPEMTKDAEGEWISQNTPLYLRDMTFAQLRHYTVGEVKPGSLYATTHLSLRQEKNQRIPLLREVFELARRKKADQLEFFIELKTSPLAQDYTSDRERLVVETLKEIEKAGVEDRVHILCFDPWSLDRVHALAPHLKTTYLMEHGLEDDSPWRAWFRFASFQNPLTLMRQKGVSSWGPEFQDHRHQLLTLADIQEAHQEGLQVVVWTPNAPEDFQKMIEAGVDGITTDRPDILMTLLKKEISL